MDDNGRWVTDLSNSTARYYVTIDGKRKAVIEYFGSPLSGSSWVMGTTMILSLRDSVMIYSGRFTKENALTFYRIACNATDNETGYTAIMAYIRMKGDNL